MNIGERFNLRDKVAVVIGGAGHLCSTLSEALMACGARVAVLDNAETAPVTLRDAVYLNCDVTSKSQLAACADTIIRRFSRVDILLNGAGTNAPTPFLEITTEEIESILGIQLISVMYSCQVFGEHMIRRRYGSIINFASVSSG